ncbi:MAG: L-amino acid N-acyltransferase YncA [Mariniblastus sp.]|jgi:L-amino acid N-acyltransferase YncA
MIRNATLGDSVRIAEIYNHYVANTLVTFEYELVSADEIVRRMVNIEAMGMPWTVWEENGTVAGYAYAGSWRERAAFLHTVESAVYLAHDHVGQGIGSQLYRDLLDRLRTKPIKIVVGMVSLPNPQSARLHERLGFTKVGEFSEVGRKFGQWIDVGAWQLKIDGRGVPEN